MVLAAIAVAPVTVVVVLVGVGAKLEVDVRFQKLPPPDAKRELGAVAMIPTLACTVVCRYRLRRMT